MASRSDAPATANDPAESAAAALSSAAFVRLVPRADGDALAAAGLLARALRGVGVPFQVRVAALGADVPASGDGVLAAVGSDLTDADVTVESPAEPTSLRAYEVASALVGESTDAGADTGTDPTAPPDPVLALAGVVAGGAHPGSAAASLVETAEAGGAIERRPGVAVPVDDPVDGLAHSTLFHAPFSGDGTAVETALASISQSTGSGTASDGAASDGAASDDGTRRAIASFLALSTAEDADATPRAATAVERALGPYATPDGPLATIGGFADVLDAAARERPGTGLALALGHGGREAALAVWRDHATAVHDALRNGHTGRYDGVFVVRGDHGDERGGSDADEARRAGRLATLARLARDFRSPEPLVLALGDGVAALSACESGAADAAAALATEFGVDVGVADATWTGTETEAFARFDPNAADADVIAAVREVAQ